MVLFLVIHPLTSHSSRHRTARSSIESRARSQTKMAPILLLNNESYSRFWVLSISAEFFHLAGFAPPCNCQCTRLSTLHPNALYNYLCMIPSWKIVYKDLLHRPGSHSDSQRCCSLSDRNNRPRKWLECHQSTYLVQRLLN